MRRILSRLLLLACLPGAGAWAQDPPVQHLMVPAGPARIEVLAQGGGEVIVILPSLGRGAADYEVVAGRLAAAGFRVLRPQPRGIGRSTGPMTGLTLHDYAADVAAVIRAQSKVPVVVVGHAYGNFVARMLASDHPELVRGVVLAAASPGKLLPGMQGPVIAPEVREAIDKAGDPALPEAQRLAYLQRAFFAPGNDPRVWLSGWHAAAQKAESEASAATPVDAWFAGGTAPILDLQAEDDAVAPRKFASVLKQSLGERVTVIVIPHAGHALAPEQPRAMAEAIAAFARRL
jgi:pimeloyl-ACP methyl ester carboxylesterase